jgi:Protein of unknown function (DUF2853)
MSEGLSVVGESPMALRSMRSLPMSDHLADIKKYTKKPINEAALAGLERTYRLVLSQADSRYVACSDPEELKRVRDNFLVKKLELKTGDLDGAVKSVCETMKGDRTKSRLTFYYLLAEHFDKLGTFA